MGMHRAFVLTGVPPLPSLPILPNQASDQVVKNNHKKHRWAKNQKNDKGRAMI